jgi:hypothetical protein
MSRTASARASWASCPIIGSVARRRRRLWRITLDELFFSFSRPVPSFPAHPCFLPSVRVVPLIPP